MKLTYSNGKVSVEIEAESQKEVFAKLSSVQEVFMEPCCGACGGDYKFVYRTASKVVGKKTETYEYPELQCVNKDCKCRLGFGTINDNTGTLFPKRGFMNEETGKYEWIGKNGWAKFEPAKKD